MMSEEKGYREQESFLLLHGHVSDIMSGKKGETPENKEKCEVK